MDNLLLLFQAPALSVDLLINGLLIGAIFALAAYGMALVWGVMNIINIAQGEFVILGGYVTLYAVQAGLPPLLAVPVSAAVLSVVGWLVYHAVVCRVVGRDLFLSILATFGVSIFLQQIMNWAFSADVQTVDPDFGTVLLMDGQISISVAKLAAFGVTFATGGVLWLFLFQTRLGQAIRATAQNARAARILGVDTNKVYAATFALNAAICGAAGSFVIMIWSVHPYIGLPYTVRAFMVVVTAGLGNLPGVVAAGLGLGAAENFAGFILGAEYQVAFVFSLMVVILVVRSQMLRRQRRYLK